MKDNKFDIAVNEMNIYDAMEEAVTSHLPFAHRLYKEIIELREKLTTIEKPSHRTQPWGPYDY